MVISVGRLASEKNWSILLDAAAFALKDHPEIRLVLIGELARAAAAGALEGGMPRSEVHHFETCALAEAASQAGQLFETGDLILVKASRGMQLETLVRHLRQRFAPAERRGSGGRGAALACYAGWEVV